MRNSSGETVPLGSFTTIRDIAGPYRVPRYNLYPAAELDGAPRRRATRRARRSQLMEKLAAETLPDGFGYEWTTLAFQQIRAGNTALFAFVLAVVFVFLVLAAQFESLTLPLAVILIVPMCLVASISGVILRGQDNNILTQVGFIVLIGLAAKNAILIVEFAKQLEDQGRDRWSAAVEAARLRLRPILMTSLAFIFGVMPLVWAIGAGAELRQTLGTAVFSGMIGVTAFGLIFTPIFYVVCRWIAEKTSRRRPRAGGAARAGGIATESAPHATDQIRFRPGGDGGRRTTRSCAAPAAMSPITRPTGALHAVVLRSPHAHARFRVTDAGEGQGDAGRRAGAHRRGHRRARPPAVPGRDTRHQDRRPALSDPGARRGASTSAMRWPSWSPTRSTRRAMRAEAIAIEWEALPHVIGAAAALAQGAPLVWPQSAAAISPSRPSSVTPRRPRTRSQAARTVSLTLVNQRLVANYLDTRGGRRRIRRAATASRSPEQPGQPQRARRAVRGRAQDRRRTRCGW